MIRAGIGISAAATAAEAVEEAVAAALAGGLRPDSALLFVDAAFAGELPRILDAAIEGLGTDALVGATAHGVLGAGREIEGGPSLVVCAQAGLEAHPFAIGGLAGDEAMAGAEIAARLGRAPCAEDLVVLLPDAGAVRPEPLLAGLRNSLGPAVVVGAGAADSAPDAPLQWCGRHLERGGVAGMVLRGKRPPRIGVTQACRPATELLQVTRTQGHWILGLDGRPALDVYREVAREPLAEDLRHAARFLLVALPRDAEAPLAPGGYVVRHVVGFAEAEKAFAIPGGVAVGERLALAVRDADAAREDLKSMLAPFESGPGALGLYFNCCARGAGFFGIEGLESAYLERSLGTTPVAGLFGTCELGPIGGVPELLTHTGVLAVIDD